MTRSAKNQGLQTEVRVYQPTPVEFMDDRCTLAARCTVSDMAVMSRSQGAPIIQLRGKQTNPLVVLVFRASMPLRRGK
jgi:hypothetical protein